MGKKGKDKYTDLLDVVHKKLVEAVASSEEI
jgi:hypothetical protein